MLKELVSSHCYDNGCVGSPYQASYLLLVYLAFLAFVGIGLILAKRKPNFDLTMLITATLIFMLVFFILGQTFFNVTDFYTQRQNNRLPDSVQFSHILSKFAGKALKLVPQGCRASYISDFDIKSEQGYTIQHSLAYFLYPIDIRLTGSLGEHTCFIAFAKAEADKLVPPGFRVVLRYSDYSLLAVKE